MRKLIAALKSISVVILIFCKSFQTVEFWNLINKKIDCLQQSAYVSNILYYGLAKN